MALVAQELPPCLVLTVHAPGSLAPGPSACPRCLNILGQVLNQGFLDPITDTPCSFLFILVWPMNTFPCAYSKSFLTYPIPSPHPYLLTLGMWPCFALSRGNGVGHGVHFLLLISTFLWILTLVLLPVDLREKTVPHLQDQHFHWPLFLHLQGPLCYVIYSCFLSIQSYSALLPLPPALQCSALLSIIPFAFIIIFSCHAGPILLAFLPH